MAAGSTFGEAFIPIGATRAGSERKTLTEALHNLRAVVAWKIFGIDNETAKASAVPSATTLLGFVHHLAWVEAWWFQHVYARQHVDYPFNWSKDEGVEFRMTEKHAVEEVRGIYEANVVRSNEIIAPAPDFETAVQVADNEYSPVGF